MDTWQTCGTHTQRQVRSRTGCCVTNFRWKLSLRHASPPLGVWHVRTLPLVPVPVPRFSPTHIVRSLESISLYTLHTVTFVVTGVVTVVLLIPLLIPDAHRAVASVS